MRQRRGRRDVNPWIASDPALESSNEMERNVGEAAFPPRMQAPSGLLAYAGQPISSTRRRSKKEPPWNEHLPRQAARSTPGFWRSWFARLQRRSCATTGSIRNSSARRPGWPTRFVTAFRSCYQTKRERLMTKLIAVPTRKSHLFARESAVRREAAQARRLGAAGGKYAGVMQVATIR